MKCSRMLFLGRIQASCGIHHWTKSDKKVLIGCKWKEGNTMKYRKISIERQISALPGHVQRHHQCLQGRKMANSFVVAVRAGEATESMAAICCHGYLCSKNMAPMEICREALEKDDISFNSSIGATKHHWPLAMLLFVEAQDSYDPLGPSSCVCSGMTFLVIVRWKSVRLFRNNILRCVDLFFEEAPIEIRSDDSDATFYDLLGLTVFFSSIIYIYIYIYYIIYMNLRIS